MEIAFFALFVFGRFKVIVIIFPSLSILMIKHEASSPPASTSFSASFISRNQCSEPVSSP